MNEPITIPRRVVIELLHQAQIAAPEAMAGVVGAAYGEPKAFAADSNALADQGLAHWANVFSFPSAPAIPEVDQLTEAVLTLVISLNTKGVLEMRAWRKHGQQVDEINITVTD